MFLSRISAPAESERQPEDIFSSAISTIFTDYTADSHGTPGSHIIYRSPRFGDLTLQIPKHPDEEQGRKLFAHYLWNAAVLAADAIETCSTQDGGSHDGRDMKSLDNWNAAYWNVHGKTVLELGAGTALPSLISALSEARSCVVTDHPAAPSLTGGAIEFNIRENILRKNNTDQQIELQTHETPQIEAFGYNWGDRTFYSPSDYGKPCSPSHQIFDRIILADCLWMPSQHINLIKTILQFLPPHTDTNPTPADSTPTSPSPTGCALVVAGFHTGRRIVSNFFSLATESATNTLTQPDTKDNTVTEDDELSAEDAQYVGKLRLAEIFEIDVDGSRREWKWWEREGETKWDAKRWCVVGVLVRR